MKDSYGREISYLRVSVTEKCNLNCKYCMPNSKRSAGKRSERLSLDELYELIRTFHTLGIRKIRLTGGEPLVREGVVSLIEKISRLSGIHDIALTTNGILLPHYIKDLKKAGLHRLNISIDTLDPEKYHDITGGGNLDEVLKGIELAKANGIMPVKVNAVLIKGFNDTEIRRFAEWSDKWGVEVRFIELMPIGEGISWSKERYLPVSAVTSALPELKKINSLPKAATAASYYIKGSQTKVGLIAPMSCKFCNECNRIRLTSDGKLKTCLHSNEEVDLKQPLRQHKNLEPLILNAVSLKPGKHHLEDYKFIQKSMYQIGG